MLGIDLSSRVKGVNMQTKDPQTLTPEIIQKYDKSTEKKKQKNKSHLETVQILKQMNIFLCCS